MWARPFVLTRLAIYSLTFHIQSTLIVHKYKVQTDYFDVYKSISINLYGIIYICVISMNVYLDRCINV